MARRFAGWLPALLLVGATVGFAASSGAGAGDGEDPSQADSGGEGSNCPGQQAPRLERKPAPETKGPGASGDPASEATAGLPRFIRWSERVTQGAQPVGEVAFKSMAALGITMAISVDGAQPDVAAAAKHGVRYVHLPIGYDRLPKEIVAKLAAAFKQAKGSIYVHCHHGRHRGPAACMAIRMVAEGLSAADAKAALVKSGTSPKYAGLYRDIAALKPPTEEEVAAVRPEDLPSSVKPAGSRAGMVDVSHRWESLKSAKATGFKHVPDHPDIAPAHEARMLWESFRELQRLEESKAHGKDYMAQLAASEKQAVALEAAIRARQMPAATKAYTALAVSCKTCHTTYRN